MTISVLDKDGNPQTLDPPTQTTLAAILAKLSSDPATQTTLAAILAKLIAAPATEAKQDAIVTALGALATAANQSTANTTLATLLTAGTPITGQSLESGGAGALGWFASIRKKIAAFGVAGTPSADVLTVQGVGGGTALPVETELPAAALLADGAALPNTPTIGNVNMFYDGSATRLARGTVRGAAYSASDYFELSLTGNAPTPSGTDLLNYTNGTPNGPVTSSQMDIRDTAWNRIYIPLAIAGWRSIVIGIATDAPFDQALTFGFQATISTAGQQYNTAQNSITLAASTTANFILTSEPGGATPSGAAAGSAYSAQFLAGAPAVVLQIRASVAPTAGTIKLVIARRST